MFAKFMNKKFFHPGSYPNIKRRWMAEQRALAKEKKEHEMRETYEKEQQTYQHKMLLAKKDEDKIKLGLNFMYDLPPGMKKEDDREDKGKDEAEVKFEWQKNAPRAMYANKLGLDVHDQPFGVCVRNVKCFKCGKWGHQNVDKECPKYNEKASESKSALDSMCLSDPLRLISDMKKDHGLTLKRSVIGSEIDPMAENQQILDSDDDDDNPDAEIAYINSLTNKQKRKLLKKLEKLEKKKSRYEKQENKLKRQKMEERHKRKRKISQAESSNDDEWEESYVRKPKKAYSMNKESSSHYGDSKIRHKSERDSNITTPKMSKRHKKKRDRKAEH